MGREAHGMGPLRKGQRQRPKKRAPLGTSALGAPGPRDICRPRSRLTPQAPPQLPGRCHPPRSGCRLFSPAGTKPAFPGGSSERGSASTRSEQSKVHPSWTPSQPFWTPGFWHRKREFWSICSKLGQAAEECLGTPSPSAHRRSGLFSQGAQFPRTSSSARSLCPLQASQNFQTGPSTWKRLSLYSLSSQPPCLPSSHFPKSLRSQRTSGARMK